MKIFFVLLFVLNAFVFGQSVVTPNLPQFVLEQKVMWETAKELPGYGWTKTFGFGWGRVNYTRKVFLGNAQMGYYVYEKLEFPWVAYCDKEGVIRIVVQGNFPEEIPGKINWEVRQAKDLTHIILPDIWTTIDQELMFPPQFLGRMLLRLQNNSGLVIDFKQYFSGR